MRGAHRAFFLDDEEKTRAVELLRRVEEFCGVMVLAYAIMSNHFHIFIFVPEPEEIDDEKARRGYAFMYGSADHWDVIRDSHEKSMREAMSEILAAREAERAGREAKGEPAPGRGANSPPSKADPGLDAPRRFTLELGARQSGGRRANLGAPVRRTDEAGGASRGGRDQEPDSLQPVLPRADAGEGACRPNRPPAPELAASGI